MKKIIVILLAVITLPLYAQKVTTIYGFKASIIYKSKDDFKFPYLQYYSATLFPGYESKTMKANPSQYKQIEIDHRQIVISRNFIFGKTGTFEDRLERLDKYLTKHKNKLLQIDVRNGMVYRIEVKESLQLKSKQK